MEHVEYVNYMESSKRIEHHISLRHWVLWCGVKCDAGIMFGVNLIDYIYIRKERNKIRNIEWNTKKFWIVSRQDCPFRSELLYSLYHWCDPDKIILSEYNMIKWVSDSSLHCTALHTKHQVTRNPLPSPSGHSLCETIHVLIIINNLNYFH